jgi:lipopolysaccharide/colanic/teichoic acid biosynthesis glycosyltransferase
MHAANALLEQDIAPKAARIPTIARMRFQLLGGLLIPTLLALALRAIWSEPQITNTATVNSVVGVSIAIIVGYFCLRKIASFPGANSLRYVVPVFACAFLGVIALFFLLRLDYSRFQFLVSCLAALAWFTIVIAISKGVARQRLAVIPAGDACTVLAIADVDWQVLTDPQGPALGVDGVVVDLRADHSPEWQRFIANCVLSSIPVFHVKQVRESLTGRLEIRHLSENTLGSLNPNDAYLKLKRMLDCAGAAVFLLACLPALILIGILVRMDSEGPALFRQVRVGRGGRPFVLYKFRTMRIAETGEGDGRAAACTLPDDRRVTRLGRFLRISRLDELPQVINILRGEMSWIGPRPEALPLSHWYQDELPFYYYRHIVYPGITGWAQVNQGHVTEVDRVLEKLHYDFYYIKNFSAWLDILILLKTVRTMLTGFGAK